MIFQRLNFTVGAHEILLDCYVNEDKSSLRDGILIFPGGGYAMVCDDREGGPIAEAYFERGLNAFVLHYAVGEDFRYPSHLIDASYAMVYLKKHAQELGIDKDRIFTVGFSAGGHLSGSMAILHADPEVLSSLGIAHGANKPCGSILAYPVVSAMCETHCESFEFLSGKTFDSIPIAERERLSLEMHVSGDSAPVFIWHTSEDPVVPMRGSLRLAEAYYNLGRTVALRIYPYGIHGLALANEITSADNPGFIEPLAEEWVDSSVAWMKTVK